ncbi:MAG: hypothetical protein IT330_06290 [Anaerolineae bacterium]|nr:hypothetical protein [Anaerolineae bacterium]
MKESNVALLALVVGRIGEAAALDFLRQTLEVEAQGGLMVSDGQRRRTPGGVFFHLVKQGLPKAEWMAWWPQPTMRKKKSAKPPQPAVAFLSREEWLQWIPEALQQPGKATTVKITLVGRPGRIVEKGGVVLTTMESSKVPTLPKGIPTPPEEPTTYIVYIAQKQWAKVAAAIQDPADRLIVEGYPALEKRLGTVAVYATQVTTTALQAAKRAADAPSG